MQRIGIFDIVGGYFADVFANAIYFNVKKTATTTKQSINDEYRKLIVSYAQSMHDDDALFESTMVNMCKYYNTVNNKSTIGLTAIEFEDLIISSFIAKEHHQKIKQVHKKQLLHNIMFETVNYLVSEIIDRPDEVMAKIFEHDANIGHTLREIAKESIKSQKETIANRLVKDNTPKASDMDLITRLKSQINQKINELVQTREDYNKSMILLNAYKSHSESIKLQLNEAKSDLNNTKSELSGAKFELNNAKSELNRARSELTQTKTDLDNARSEISSSKTDNSSVNQRIIQLTKENEDQRRRITEMDNKIRLLSSSSFPTQPQIQPIMTAQIQPTTTTQSTRQQESAYPTKQQESNNDDEDNIKEEKHAPSLADDEDNVEHIEYD